MGHPATTPTAATVGRSALGESPSRQPAAESDEYRHAYKDYGITVDDDLTLINTSLNKYDGLATVHTRKGTQKYLEVDVWADPTGAMFYQMNPGSAASLIEAAGKEQREAGEY